MPRTYDLARVGLRFGDWPEIDQTAWKRALAAGDVLDGRGPAAHWAKATRKTNMHHYGRWLAFLERTDRLSDEDPASRVTADVVREYGRELRLLVAPRTVVTLLVGLKVTIKAMAPDRGWRWLADLCNALNRSSKPLNRKHARLRPSEEIYAAAIAELTRLNGCAPKGRKWLCAYRDTLMIAFLAARPLRLKNFTALELGRHLVRNEKGWLITIPGQEVKNGQPLEYELIESLVPYLERYLATVRPAIMASSRSNCLWTAWKKPALTSREVYHCIVAKTTSLLGAPINPHLFRDCAATSLSLVSTAAARAAAPLLGHRFFSTTERHYVRARQLEASRMLNTALSSIKSSVR
jgi:site-specific recombinase XerD